MTIKTTTRALDTLDSLLEETPDASPGTIRTHLRNFLADVRKITTPEAFSDKPELGKDCKCSANVRDLQRVCCEICMGTGTVDVTEPGQPRESADCPGCNAQGNWWGCGNCGGIVSFREWVI